MTKKKHVETEKPKKKKKFRKSKQGMVEPDSKAGNSEAILMLAKTAPPSKEVAGLLALPDDLHAENRWSFTSEKGKSVQAVADSFMRKSPMPNELPEYGINISTLGSNTFCTLVDRKRKVIVFESIGNMQVPEGGSWRFFQGSMKDALARAKELEDSGTNFTFVISNSGIVTYF